MRRAIASWRWRSAASSCAASSSVRMRTRDQLVALLVDHLALVVGDVVVLEQLLADVEVVRLRPCAARSRSLA
jgi:hypothetical protein